jgi:hypothetical protein
MRVRRPRKSVKPRNGPRLSGFLVVRDLPMSGHAFPGGDR